MKINFAQPGRMGRFVRVDETPSQFLSCSVSLVKIARKLRMHDAGDPVHDENLAARELLCLVERGDRVLYISVAFQQRHRGGMLGAKQAYDSQVQRLLNRCQLRLKFPKIHAEKFYPLVLQVRIRKLGMSMNISSGSFGGAMLFTAFRYSSSGPCSLPERMSWLRRPTKPAIMRSKAKSKNPMSKRTGFISPPLLS